VSLVVTISVISCPVVVIGQHIWGSAKACKTVQHC